MISIERMNKSNSKRRIEQMKEQLSEFYENEINTRFFLTDGRPRNEIFKGKKASFIKLIPEVVNNIENKIYIVPEVISYERIVGDWTFNRQDLMKNPKLLIEWMENKIPAKYFSKLTKEILKNNNIKHLLHNSAVFWDAIALLYNSSEPNTKIHIDYLDPILIKGNENSTEFYKNIEQKIYDNIRVSASNILSYIIINHYQNDNGTLKYSETINKIDELKENLIDKKVPLFHNVENSSGEEIFENGNRVLRESRLIPAFICKGEEIFMNPKSKLLKYYASRFFDYKYH